MTAPGTQLGVVAAGHPLSARAGADALLAGGNAVDAALGAMLASFACEPLLTGLGAGGYMLVSRARTEGGVTLLDFFVEAPGRGIPPTQAAERSELIPVPVSFGDAVQTFHVGEASVGTFGMPAGVCEAARRFGRLPLEQLVAPAARLAREGVPLNPQQAYIVEILGAIVTSTPEAAALFAPDGRLLRAGERLRQPELGDALERLGADGARPFYEGRHRRRHRRLAGRAGRPGDQGGPPRLRGGRPRAGPCRLSRPRRAHQPAAVGRRDPHRPRPRCGWTRCPALRRSSSWST